METYSGSNATVAWDDAGVELDHGTMSARAVGVQHCRAPWSKVLGAVVEGGMVKYVRLEVDGHDAPTSPASDRYAVATKRPGDAERLVEAFRARAACTERSARPPEGQVVDRGPGSAPAVDAFRPWMRRAFSAEIFAWNVTLFLMVGVPLLLVVALVIWVIVD